MQTKFKSTSQIDSVMTSSAGESLYHQCCDVHAFGNSIPYVLTSDLSTWHTPLETMTVGHAVCHDYAVLKYFMLLGMGIPAEQLSIVTVAVTGIALMHVVLQVVDEDSGSVYILDNRRESVTEQDFCSDLTPIFGINHKELVTYKNDWTVAAVRKADQDSEWVNLLVRIAKELEAQNA